jgi:hypothetical protein
MTSGIPYTWGRSFNVISQEEFDARRKEEAVAATTAALPAKPHRRFSVAEGVTGVVPKIKKKSDKGLTPISGKVGHVMLSTVLEYCILIAFLFLGYFSQSVRSFDVAVLSNNWTRTSKLLKHCMEICSCQCSQLA